MAGNDTSESTEKPKLVMTVGLPRSGKSTWAKSAGHPIVNPDAIRLSLHGHRFYEDAEPFVWAIAHVMVNALFAAGHRTVVLDACNTSFERRKEWKSSNYDIELKKFPAKEEECIARARAAGDESIVPIIKRMAQEGRERAAKIGG